MTQEDLNFFRELLLAKREETKEELDELQSYRDDNDNPSENSQYPSHMAELGTDAQEREKKFLIVQRLSSFLKYVNEALYRIEKGTYGICTSCQKEISKERLEAVPHTQLCVDCKMKKN